MEVWSRYLIKVFKNHLKEVVMKTSEFEEIELRMLRGESFVLKDCVDKTVYLDGYSRLFDRYASI